MKISIHSIQKEDDQNNECVWLEVMENCNLDYYVLCDTTYTGDGKISNKLRHMYWFPKTAVKKGDYVRLFTKSGKQSSSPNERKTTTHNFYWGLDRPVWNDEKDRAILFELNTWVSKGA